MSSKRPWVIAAAAVVLALVVLLGISRRRHKPADAESVAALPVASFLPAERGEITQDLTVAGVFQPFQEIDVHGKVSGYVRKITVDIGDRVRRGQTLAVLEIPELQAQVAGANAGVERSQQETERLRSEVARAEASYAATHANYIRLKSASDQQPGLVPAQELDDAQARDRVALSQIEAAKSAVAAAQGQLAVSRADRLRVSSLANYATITAPFSGVVTMRYADTGALIPAGTSESNAQAVVRLAQSDVLRLRMPVPEADVALVREGLPVTVHVQATGQQFAGTVVRFTRDVSNETRTMVCEVDVPNPDLALAPGIYADVSFHLRRSSGSLLVPSAAVVQGDRPTLFVVDADGIVRKQPVVLGITSANEQEIASGLAAGERVIVPGTDAFQPGEKVEPKLAARDLVTYQAAKGGK